MLKTIAYYWIQYWMKPLQVVQLSSEMQRAKFMAPFQVLLAPGAYVIETAALYFRMKFIAPLVLLKERRGR